MTPSSRVLAALGLSGVVGCGDGCVEEAHPCLSLVGPDAGPCLEMRPEPPPPPTDSDDPGEAQPTACLNIAPEPTVAPCLEVVEPPPPPPSTRPPRVGPCLKFAPEPRTEPEPRDPQGALRPAPGRPVDAVLARGVLPDDIAALLAGRRG